MIAMPWSTACWPGSTVSDISIGKQINTPIEHAVCQACAIEMDAARAASRADEFEAIEHLRLFA